MKRTPLHRATGIVRRTTMRRAPLESRAAPLRAVSAKHAAKGSARRRAERELGREGQMGLCAMCRRRTYVNGHERRARSQGGDPTKPDCLLCIRCNTWCEDNPAQAALTGWKISKKHPRSTSLADDEAIDMYGGVVKFRRAE